MAQLELCKKGILPKDIYMGMNVTETEQYEDWERLYEREFEAPAEHERAYLIFRGVEIMANGSDWAPLYAFHCRDKGRHAKAFALVKDIGCNILRCLGGSVCEDHKFFDLLRRKRHHSMAGLCHGVCRLSLRRTL